MSDVIHGDCLTVMASLDESSIDAIVTDPPYGLAFMGKEWDKLANHETRVRSDPTGKSVSPFYRPGWGQTDTRTPTRESQAWHERWATEAFRVAKPGAYLLSFGGTRTVHRMTCAIEDAGWIVRDMLVWAYATGFPKSKALLKPAWEPIVMARKPGPLRELAIDACRVGTDKITQHGRCDSPNIAMSGRNYAEPAGREWSGRWPANIVLTDPVFGDCSKFFLIPKASRKEREPAGQSDLPRRFSPTMGNGIGAREHDPANEQAFRVNTHPTVKPIALMRHLVRLVTPAGGTVLDPFLGSGTTALAAQAEGFDWIGIEKESEYVTIAKARLAVGVPNLGLIA